MADLTFNTTEGQTIDRELLIAYLNTGTSSALCGVQSASAWKIPA